MKKFFAHKIIFLFITFMISITSFGLSAKAFCPTDKQIEGSNIKAVAKIKDVHITINVINDTLIYTVDVDFKRLKNLGGDAPSKFKGQAFFYKNLDDKTHQLKGTISTKLNTDNISDKVLVFINDDLGDGHMMFCHILSNKIYKEIKKNGLKNIEFDLNSIKLKVD